MLQINDPRAIPQSDMPFHFVLSNQATDLVSFLIDWKTKSNYDHVMQAIDARQFITQDFGGYHKVDMGNYLKKGGQLKFIKITNATELFNISFRSTILNRLAQPWFKKIYDYGNILGRVIGFPWLRLPGTYDCSEIALWIVKQNLHYLPIMDASIINGIPNNASPDDIDMTVKNNPTIFTEFGIWSGDEGVIV